MSLEVLIPWIAGFVALPVINFVKSRLNLSGKAAVYLALAVSVAGAAVALFVSGGFTGEDLLANLTIVFTTATALYKLLPDQVASFGE